MGCAVCATGDGTVNLASLFVPFCRDAFPTPPLSPAVDPAVVDRRLFLCVPRQGAVGERETSSPLLMRGVRWDCYAYASLLPSLYASVTVSLDRLSDARPVFARLTQTLAKDEERESERQICHQRLSLPFPSILLRTSCFRVFDL